MSELLLELFSEEIPALMQKKAEEAYLEIFKEAFADSSISYEKIEAFVGPRRIAIYAAGLPRSFPAKEIEIKGPSIDAQDSAIEGFCRVNGIARSQLRLQTNAKGQTYYICAKQLAELNIKDALLQILPKAIMEYVWPKSMVWGEYELRWVRPLRNILCLFDGAVLPIKLGHLTANNVTFVRKIMSAKEENDGQKEEIDGQNLKKIELQNFEEYRGKLKENGVIIDRKERQRIIEEGEEVEEGKKGLKGKAAELGLSLNQDHPLLEYEKLLEEVTGLVEYPVVMTGKIEERFFESPRPFAFYMQKPTDKAYENVGLPHELIIVAMKSHQRYFSLFYKEEGRLRLARDFLFVSNIPSSDSDNEIGKETVKEIVEGNQKVLRARLSDALYLYQQDLKLPISYYEEQLQKMSFYKNNGSIQNKVERIAEKVERMKELGELLLALAFGSTASPNFSNTPSPEELLATAIKLCKLDLASQTVQEFPELQGIMGYYYALSQGKDRQIAVAIRDHYKPVGISDKVPFGLAASLALVDKLDDLIVLMSEGEQVTASKDPHGLRRMALGIIRIIVENFIENRISKIRFRLKPIISEITNDRSLTEQVLKFILERARFYFIEKRGYARCAVNAVIDEYLDLAADKYADNPIDILVILDEIKLKDFLSKPEGKNLLAAYKRLHNILRNTERPNEPLTEQDFSSKYESELYESAQEVDKLLEEIDIDKQLDNLSSLAAPLNNFLDNITVMDRDPNIARKRLALLHYIKSLFPTAWQDLIGCYRRGSIF